MSEDSQVRDLQGGVLTEKKRRFEMPQKFNLRKIAISLAMFAVVVVSSAYSAKADTVTFSLSNGNPAIAGYPGPYAHVDVTQTSSTTATIVFTAESHGGFDYLFGGQGAIGLNFNGGPVTVNTSSLAFGPGGLSLGGAANEDGFGQFNFTLDNFDGFTNAFTTLTLTVTCASCNWLANSTNVLTPNDSGNSAAGHIFVSCPTCTDALATGYATNGSNPAVPEPASMLLLGTGLLGIAGVARRRFRK
jgi:hypothetical protein